MYPKLMTIQISQTLLNNISVQYLCTRDTVYSVEMPGGKLSVIQNIIPRLLYKQQQFCEQQTHPLYKQQ